MKFAEHLGAHITPEWRKQYVQYEEMKAMLYAALEEAPSPEAVEPEVLHRHFAAFDETFFTFCDKELTKINTFYSEKLAEATRKFATLKSELASASEARSGHGGHGGGSGGGKGTRLGRAFRGAKGGDIYKERVPARKLQDLKLAFSEFYLSLVLLQNYQNLNYTGFRKILKKRDKNLKEHGCESQHEDAGARWRAEHVDTALFYTNKAIDKLIAETESTFISELEGGDRQRAMKRLRVPPLGDQQSPWTTFKVGLFSGAFLVLIIAVVLSSIFHDYGSALTSFNPLDISDDVSEEWRVVFRLYRGPLLVILFVFLMGINVYGWRSSGVNHVLIFELDPRNHLSEQHLMELAAILGVVWTLSVLTFLYSHHLAIPAYLNPLALVLIMLAFMLNPTKTFRHEARFWMLRVLLRIVCAPFFYVGFADFWVADQLNSLAVAFTDFHYTVCFYSTYFSQNISVGDWHSPPPDAAVEKCSAGSNWVRSVVLCLPAWFRFAQCLRRYRDTREAFPHLVNAGKYSTTFFVVLFATLQSWDNERVDRETGGDLDGENYYSGFFYPWVLAAVANTTYAYAWDILMDWGLFDSNAGENRFLREEIVYSSKGYYYFAIVEDLVLRCSWAISAGLKRGVGVDGDLIGAVTSALEVFRRFVWNFFRLENEHLNNCGKFRAVRDISVAPLDASDQQLIIRMMDEEDGIIAVRRRKNAGGNTAAGALASSALGLRPRTRSHEALAPLLEAVESAL